MKVSDLQQHLGDLARLLDSSGAKAVAGDLAAVSGALAPFREQSLKAFGEFLIRAEAASRGESASPGKRTTAKVAAPPTDVAGLLEEVRRLYGSAADPSVTREQIDALAARLSPLKKDDLVQISEAIGMVGSRGKTKDKIQQAIRDRIVARKGASQRAALIDRQGPPEAAASGDPE